MHLAKVDEVIKASPAIQIENKITHLQRRAWNVLLANAYNELPEKDIHTISVGELAAKLGFHSHNLDHLKEALRELRACEVQWNILGKNDKEEWGVAGLLADARIRDGICHYSFAPQLRMKLYNPLMYTRLNLRLQNEFKSQYALILWEVCFDYFDVHWGQGQTPFIPLETFKELMGIESHEYLEFRALNRNLIKPAIKEINTLTDYFVEVEQKRIGRKVGELKFRIEKVKTLPVQESVFPDVEELPPVAVELVQVDVDRALAVRIAVAEWEFINPEKLPSLGDYPDFLEYVSEKIEMASHASGVNNGAGYVVEAIRNNYQNDRVQKKRAERAVREKEKALEDLDEVLRAKRETLIRQLVQSDPDLIEAAVASIKLPYARKRIERSDNRVQAYQEIPMIKALADDIIVEDLCQEKFAPMYAEYEQEKTRILAE